VFQRGLRVVVEGVKGGIVDQEEALKFSSFSKEIHVRGATGSG